MAQNVSEENLSHMLAKLLLLPLQQKAVVILYRSQNTTSLSSTYTAVLSLVEKDGLQLLTVKQKFMTEELGSWLTLTKQVCVFWVVDIRLQTDH